VHHTWFFLSAPHRNPMWIPCGIDGESAADNL
jgi:hypothetical protein